MLPLPLFPLFIEGIKNALFGQIVDDIQLILFGFKIVILLFIISFVRSRFGGGPIVTILVLLFGYIMLFTDYFVIFGPMMFIYLFIAFGFITIVFDLAIAKPWKKMDLGGGPDTTGKEKKEQIEQYKKMRMA